MTNSPPAIRYPHQLDLGDAWMRTTGYPFVFAMWVARAHADHKRLRTIARILDRQRRLNMSKIDRLGADAARAHGWPLDLAAEYLGERLRFSVTDDALAGLTKFFDMAHDIGAIDTARHVHCLDW